MRKIIFIMKNEEEPDIMKKRGSGERGREREREGESSWERGIAARPCHLFAQGLVTGTTGFFIKVSAQSFTGRLFC
jgi:hypothetical protein